MTPRLNASRLCCEDAVASTNIGDDGSPAIERIRSRPVRESPVAASSTSTKTTSTGDPAIASRASPRLATAPTTSARWLPSIRLTR